MTSTLTRSAERPGRALRLGFSLLALVSVFAAAAAPARAQVVPGGDFDICDYCGNLVGNVMHLVGRSGFGTVRGTFVLVNGANSDQDIDKDGYTAGVDFNNLVVRDTADFVNVSNPALVILRTNLVIADFLNPLRNGFSRAVPMYVNIPNGTPAGIYRGRIAIADSVLLQGTGVNGRKTRVDDFIVEVEVLANSGIGLVQADTGARADSLVLRGRPGQTVSGVFRVANLGNTALTNVRVDATDLVATSGTGLRIRREAISFTPGSLTSVVIGDSSRITVTVRIPTGILAGAYRGDLIVQANDVVSIRVPLTVIVTTPGDIVFENNPVIGRAGDLGVIIFNADPGTTWQMAIFDMMAVTTFRANGTVFAGGGATQNPNGTLTPGADGDQAVRFTWPLLNGRGEAVAGGMYYVIVEATQNGVRRQLRNKLMVIR
ncbi:MAG: hypothetical protein M3068_03385 [Gemmatimonadota bacterium]|nr:hypothetical protein [Gemmatimonadota bacterium]